MPDQELFDLNEFLSEIGVITKLNHTGKHTYNDEYLVHYPETKLLYKGKWHDGLIPYTDLTDEEKNQINIFFNLVENFSKKIGSDGKKAFAIPIRDSSHDKNFIGLDKVGFKDFLVSKGINSEFIFWFVDYATKDDYGSNIAETSAWAGLHYFASRPKSSDIPDIFTWPEGNGFLINEFKKKIKAPLNTNSLVIKVEPNKDGFQVMYYDAREARIFRVNAKAVISSLPHFINKRDFKNNFELPQLDLDYVPWLVGNLSIPILPESFQNIPWDSVSFHSDSLGFVRADHQNLYKSNN